MNNIFINEAITNGINSYIAKYEKHEYITSHLFELSIIEILVKLYGKIDIINTFQTNNEREFKSNLTNYGAKEEDIEKLFLLLDDYNLWLNSNSKNKQKNILMRDIFIIIAKLVICKEREIGIDSNEMNFYKTFFNLENNKIRNYVVESSENVEEVLNAYNIALKEIEKDSEEPKKEYLSEEQYEKFGLVMEDVEKLPDEKLEKLNEDILLKEKNANDEQSGGTTKRDKPRSLVLSSGNGFIDALVLLSIMCTEIMVGIIVTVILARLR